MASAQVESARLQLALGDLPQAGRLLKAALATAATERGAGRADRNLRLLEAQAHVVHSQLDSRRNDEAGAREHGMRARDAIADDARIGANPNFLSAWASALLLLGEVGAARPSVDQLAAMGYRTPDFAALLAARKQTYALVPLAQRCGSGESSPAGKREIR
jgi:hypothetical protein